MFSFMLNNVLTKDKNLLYLNAVADMYFKSENAGNTVFKVLFFKIFFRGEKHPPPPQAGGDIHCHTYPFLSLCGFSCQHPAHFKSGAN